MIRAPAVAGQFYASTKPELVKQLDACFKSKLGPGILKKAPTKKFPMVSAGIAPHAGYPYSGAVAAHLFNVIKYSKQADTYIIIGPNHTGQGAPISISGAEAWATPLGQVKLDNQIAQDLVDETGMVDIEEIAHLYEHSIEVQVPFLQHVQKTKKFKIVPICMARQELSVAQELGEAIAKVCADKKVTVIASTDFSHYITQKQAEAIDSSAIKEIETLNIFGFNKFLQAKQPSICGPGPMITAMAFAREKGAQAGHLLKYATSGATTKDLMKVVGYASMLFE
jgi:hypothetical protein|tara:strand:- start:4011 stop:4856 length:846 start_codon:yes stop_codon:yes gene_type:complete